MTNTEHPLWAAVYDPFSLPFELLGIRRQHARIGEDARGRVLDLGIRTGLSLPFYTHADEVVGVDPDPHMLKRARRRAEHVAFPVRLVEAPAESLPFGDNEFDAVVIVFGLCTFPDPDAAVREARRVLKPNGRLLFLEHVQSGRPRLARMLDLLTALSRRFTGGCLSTGGRLKRSRGTSRSSTSGTKASSCRERRGPTVATDSPRGLTQAPPARLSRSTATAARASEPPASTPHARGHTAAACLQATALVSGEERPLGAPLSSRDATSILPLGTPVVPRASDRAQNRVGPGLTPGPPTPPDMRVRIRRFALRPGNGGRDRGIPARPWLVQ